MKTRGQAALEFLSTYGFAFLIILVMIGALSYFGVLSPGRFLPERCLISQEFTCDEFQLERTSAGGMEVSIVLVNNLGNSVTFNDINFTTDFGAGSQACAPDDSSAVIGGGEAQWTACTIGPGTDGFPAVGEKIRVRFDGTYKELGKTFDRRLDGEIFATLQ